MRRFELADLRPRPGTRFVGRYTVAEGVGFPLWICHGKRPGPSLLLTAGVHGDEYEGPSALRSLYEVIEPARLCGTVIAIPVVNWPAWIERARFDSQSGLDLNRCFGPGMVKIHTPTGQLVDALLSHFVKQADVVMDFHSGGLRLQHLPLAGWYRQGADSEAEQLARRFYPHFHPWQVPEVEGVLSCEAHRLGKVAMGFEWGGGACLSTDGTDAILKGIQRVMQQLQMLPGDVGTIAVDSRPAIEGNYQTVPHQGFFHPDCSLGQFVEKGAPIGRLLNFENCETFSVSADRSGILAGIAHLPWLRKGDRLAYIG
ncbi:MAG: succinylglutamate desuccinylase/aspartoacylase family protein [Opitutales bacterium]|nr:succinylglutamate desuccinylase/aspartoacylase family protein [Opitutales bacterium]